MTAVSLFALVCASVPALLGLCNLFLYRRLPPPDAGSRTPVSVLIPARNEERRIEGALRSVLASQEVEFEILVLDDGSEDATAAVVGEVARQDGRVQLLEGDLLPPGWSGKQYACHVLGRAAQHPLLLFLDADVRLSPDALARLVSAMRETDHALVSGLPRQIALSVIERLVVPQIHLILLGFLPICFMRMFRWSAFAAGCGQLMLVRRDAYLAADGHRAIRHSRHDGIALPRTIRKHGYMTDLRDLTGVARCRMYEGAAQVWEGFAKNATEGMARPIALPVWTALLFGGQVLPFVLLAWGVLFGLDDMAWVYVGSAVGLTAAFRVLLALRFRQSATGVLLHPIGVLLVLAIQWWAFACGLAGRPISWRGRDYATEPRHV